VRDFKYGLNSHIIFSFKMAGVGIGCAESKRNQLPSCIGKEICVCFEELNEYNSTFTNFEDYVLKIKKQIQHYLFLIHLHQNKEEIVETNEVCHLKAHKIRDAVYFTDLTRMHFLNWIKAHGDCDVLLSSKKVLASEILQVLESLIHSWDLSLELFYLPESTLPIRSLKNCIGHPS